MPVANRFHLAFPVRDLQRTRAFYVDVLGCVEGRSAERWVDLDLYGHQLSAHVVRGAGDRGHNPVDGDAVPIPHFGVILDIPTFHSLAARLTEAAVDWVIEPRVRFAGEVGEQWTMFLRDPSGNALEFKAFANDAQVFRASGPS